MGSTATAKADVWALVAVVSLAAWLRLAGLGSPSLWIDEATSWLYARMPLIELWTDAPTYEVHPPLYYTILKVSIWFIGDSEWALRFLSTCAGLLTVALVYCIGRIALGPREGLWVGVVSAAIVALHPVQIYYSQEARAYALLTLGAAMVLLALIWWLRHPETLAISPAQAWRSSNRGSLRAVALFVVGCVLGFWMHYTAALLLGSVAGFGVLLVLSAHADQRRMLSNLAFCAAAIIALWLPCAFMLHGLRGSYWILPPSLYEVIDRTDLLVGSAGIASTPRLQALVLALVGMAVLAGAAALAVRGRWRVALLLSAATVLPIAGAVATSFAIMPIFIPRILVWIQLSAALLVASALLWLPSGSVRTLGAAALAGMVAALSAGYPFAREPWREIVELLAARTTTQDLIVVWPNSVHFPLLYYGGHQRVPAAYLRLWDGTGDYPTPYQAFSFTGQQSPSIQELLERLRHHTAENDGNVWLVTRAGLQTEVVAGIDRLLESQRGAPMTEVTFVIPGGLDPPVRVVRYPPKQHK